MKNIVVKLPKVNGRAEKINEIASLLGEEIIINDYESVIVFNTDGTYDTFESVPEDVTEETSEVFYARGDRKLSKKLSGILSAWSDENSTDDDDDDDNDEDLDDDDVITETKNVEAPIIENQKVVGDEKAAVIEILHKIFGAKIPEGVGVEFVVKKLEEAVEKPYAAFLKVDGGKEFLTLTELRLLSLLFKTLKELRQNPALKGFAVEKPYAAFLKVDGGKEFLTLTELRLLSLLFKTLKELRQNPVLKGFAVNIEEEQIDIAGAKCPLLIKDIEAMIEEADSKK